MGMTEPHLHLQAMSPLFTGDIKAETAISKRLSSWFDWSQTEAHINLRKICRGVSISPYYPGMEVFIPKRNDPDAITITFPPSVGAKVPKGLLARLHLFVLMERVEREYIDPANAIFACIDGSGAFNFDSLQLLVDPFIDDPELDVVFGRRPENNPGMPLARKVIEEFEQYLLFRHRSVEIARTFAGYDFTKHILPDGQAGCWAFRLKVGAQLQLAASGYEIEFDLLASALDEGLKACYSKPLLMSTAPRVSLASLTAVPMSIQKLRFIERKLRISRNDIITGWKEFEVFARTFDDGHFLQTAFSTFPDTRPDSPWAILPAYHEALIKYCTGY
jgi:hypothetical protein